MNITAQDVAKLRKMTGAGMMDCKKALVEAESNYDKAQEIIREKGKLVAAKRADRETSEGAVIAKVSDDHKHGVLVCWYPRPTSYPARKTSRSTTRR